MPKTNTIDKEQTKEIANARKENRDKRVEYLLLVVDGAYLHKAIGLHIPGFVIPIVLCFL